MMVQGEMLWAGTSTTTVLSPWFESCGDSATFAAEVFALSSKPADGSVEIRVETKRLEDPDSAAVALDRIPPGFWILGDVGVYSARYAGFKELVRFRYLVSSISPAKEFGVHLRMLPPLWQGNSICCSVEKVLAKETEATF